MSRWRPLCCLPSSAAPDLRGSEPATRGSAGCALLPFHDRCSRGHWICHPLTTETERKHSIQALTSGAMAEVWAWVLGKIPSGVEVFDAHEDNTGFSVPFVRLNPHRDYEKEFERCVGRSFMGLKLHPLAQQFELDDERVARLLGMAAEAGVPVLIHP